MKYIYVVVENKYYDVNDNVPIMAFNTKEEAENFCDETPYTLTHGKKYYRWKERILKVPFTGGK